MFAKYYNLFNWADRVYRDRYRGGARPRALHICRPNWGLKGKKGCFLETAQNPGGGGGGGGGGAKKVFFWWLPKNLPAPPPPPHQRVWMTGLNPALFKKLLFESNIIVIHINFLQYVVYYSSIDH